MQVLNTGYYSNILKHILLYRLFFNFLDSNPGRRTSTLQSVLPYCGPFFLRAFGSFQEPEEYLQMECSGSSLRSVRSYFCDRDSCKSQTKVCLSWWYLLMLNFCGTAVHYGDNVAVISSARLCFSSWEEETAFNLQTDLFLTFRN